MRFDCGVEGCGEEGFALGPRGWRCRTHWWKGNDPGGITIPADQFERIAAVVREAKAMYPKYRTESLNVVIAALTPDDIEAVQP